MPKFECRVCHSSLKREHYKVREIDLGINSNHEYGTCTNCDAISLITIPENLSDYYQTENYYSLSSSSSQQAVSSTWKKQLLKKAMFGQGALWSLLSTAISSSHNYKHLKTPILLSRLSKLKSGACILDVGCGVKHSFSSLSSMELGTLDGCDPFIENTIQTESGTIYKSALEDLPTTTNYSMIVFSHSLEHMEDQASALSYAKKHLAPGGSIIVLLPMGECYDIQQYGASSTLFEAPRHFILHSSKSFTLLVNEAGLKITSELWQQPLRSLCRSHYTQTVGLKSISKLPNDREITESLGQETFRKLYRTAHQLNGIPGQASIALYRLQPQ